MGSDMLSLFSLIIGVYLIYAAIVGRGKLYENEYLNCPRETVRGDIPSGAVAYWLPYPACCSRYPTFWSILAS